MNKKDVFKKLIKEFQDFKTDLLPRNMHLPVNLNKIVTLFGPRRCGKTYLFYQIIQELRNEKIKQESIFYIDFEDERIQPFEKSDFESLMDSYYELYPENLDKKTYLFFDEIQEAPLWEKFIRRVSKKGNLQIFLTGSSSKLFSKEIATSLRGRTLSFFLMPFSFKEFLRFKKFSVDKHLEYSSHRHEAAKLFQEYLQFGGFPEILDKEEPFKTQILQEYFELIFYRDIVERYRIRNFNVMKDLMRYLISNFSSLFSLTKYYNILKSSGQKIGKDTLFEYLSFLEDVSFVKLVPLFDYSLKKQTINPKKVYCIDTGLINAVSFSFSENRGRFLENLVFLELLRRRNEIYYYKDKKGREVDFLITNKGKPKQLIQVCRNLNNMQTREREIPPLLSAAKELNINNCLILTEDQKEEIIENKIHISSVPVWQWMLEI